MAWSLGLFGLLRLGWVEAHVALPLTQLQARLAADAFGAAVSPIQVTLACSGADALALCTAAILTYPASWRMRLGGASAGVALILALNTARIGTLGRVAGSPAWFEALHIYVWPAALMLAGAGYVFTWMRFSDASRVPGSAKAIASFAGPSMRRTNVVGRRFLLLTAGLLVLFVGASPLYLDSAGVLAAATFVARAAAQSLRLLGVDAVANGSVLSTSRGAFLVTQECIATPVLPVYLAAVIAYSSGWRRCAVALLAAVPLVIALGIARLLVVALPAVLVSSPDFVIHAFYQLLLAAAIVVLAARWCHGTGAAAWRRACIGAALGGAFAYLFGSAFTRALASPFAEGTRLDDPQGALAFLPPFQIGLYVALSLTAFVVVAWPRFVKGLALLVLSQAAIFFALHVVAYYAGVAPEVRDVRALALAGPLMIVAVMVAYDTPRR